MKRIPYRDSRDACPYQLGWSKALQRVDLILEDALDAVVGERLLYLNNTVGFYSDFHSVFYVA